MGAANFVLTGELLREVLNLPVYVRIVDVTACPMNPYSLSRDIEIVVESPDLPDVPDGAALPVANPQWSRIEPVNFDGWGLPDYPHRLVSAVSKCAPTVAELHAAGYARAGDPIDPATCGHAYLTDIGGDVMECASCKVKLHWTGTEYKSKDA